MERNTLGLTSAQLRDIQARRRSDGDVMVLLWDIRRLHMVLQRADQISRVIRSHGTEQMLLDALRSELENFPILKEWEAERAEMLQRPGRRI